MYDEENLKTAAEWIYNEKIVINGEAIEADMTEDQKYSVLKNYYSSPHFNNDDKKALKEKALANDKSDKASKCEQLCNQSLPDPEQKERIWAAITDITNTEGLQAMQIKMQGFFRRNQQLDLIQPYFEKYFDVLGEIVEKRDREYGETFMTMLSPAFMARESEEKAFREYLRNPVYQDRDYFVRFLKKQMEVIDTVRKSRTLCMSSMLD